MTAAPVGRTEQGVQRFGTRLLLTTIESAGSSHAWTRHPGDLAPRPFVPAAHATELLPPEVPGALVRLVTGRAAGPGRTYRTDSAHTLAEDLLERRRCRDLDHLVPTFADLGAALRRLHEQPAPPAHALGGARALDRLRDWLEGRAGSSRLDPLADRLGGGARRRLIDLATPAPHETVVSHGAASLGSLVGPGARGYDLLTGEDLCLADHRFDLGFVVGELAELAWQLAWEPSAWSPLVRALCEGYGTDDSVVDWAALRMAVHAHDIAAYTAVDEAVLAPYARWIRHLLGEVDR
ncbi:hypothetical protein GCM10027425_10010 [Alteromonas gracilis]